jgi:hypothetical protein
MEIVLLIETVPVLIEIVLEAFFKINFTEESL